MDQAQLRELSDRATVRLLDEPGTVSSERGGWMGDEPASTRA